MAAVPTGVLTDPDLVAQGWKRRYLAEPTRAKEAVETYTAAGFEVYLQALEPTDFSAKCQACAAAGCMSYVVVYTRIPPEKTP